MPRVDRFFHEHDDFPWQRGPGRRDRRRFPRICRSMVEVDIDYGHPIVELEIASEVSGLRLHSNHFETREPFAHERGRAGDGRIECCRSFPATLDTPAECEDVRVEYVGHAGRRAIVKCRGHRPSNEVVVARSCQRRPYEADRFPLQA